MPVFILVADGARPDSLAAAMDDGALPALARLREEGGAHVVTSAFPSVTGPAYTPFILGRYPGPVGLPALRWYDRERSVAAFPHFTRSYVGHEMRHVDRDLDEDAPTLFELAGPSIGALSVITRGLERRDRVGRGFGFALRAARTHFRGDVRGWLDIDRAVGDEVVRRVREDQPNLVFAALTGIDKASHAEGHQEGTGREAMRIVDDVAAELRHEAERAGTWDDTQLWIVSDHGHSPVREHEDLAGVVQSFGNRVLAHPWIYRWRPNVAVMVSGNAMAHLYLDLESRQRPWWPKLGGRWQPLVDSLLERRSVDVMLLPESPTRCTVLARGRGRAVVTHDVDGEGRRRYSYLPVDGDPLGAGELRGVCAAEAYDATFATDYPDAVVQIAHLAGSARGGEIVLSAARGWDFRAKWEPIPHLSSHGALHREHMLVPFVTNRPVAARPRRTADVMPSALDALGVPVPGGLDGRSFL